MNNLATALFRRQGKFAEAVAIVRMTLEIRRRVLGEEHLSTLGSIHNLANALFDQGKCAEAEAFLRKTLEIQRRVLDEEHPDTLASMHNLAGALLHQGKYAEAEALLRKTLEIQRRVLGEKHPRTRSSRNGLAWLLATTGDGEVRDPARAVELARLNTRVAPEDGNLWNTLGVALCSAGSWKEALAALETSEELRDGGDAFDWFFVAIAKHKLGHKDAREWYDNAVAWMEKNKPDDEELRRFRAEAGSGNLQRVQLAQRDE